MREEPPGGHRHHAAQPQRDGRPAGRRPPVPASARPRHQQQPADARARLRGSVAAHHARSQEQPDRRRRVPEGFRPRRPPESAQRQRQQAVALSQPAALGHHARVLVHGQQQPGRDTQGRQQTRQVLLR